MLTHIAWAFWLFYRNGLRQTPQIVKFPKSTALFLCQYFIDGGTVGNEDLTEKHYCPVKVDK